MDNRSWLFRGALVVLFFGILTAAYALVQIVFYGASLQALLTIGGSFGCFGALLGGIFAFDPESEIKIKGVKGSTPARVGVGILAGIAVVALWKISAEALVLGGLVGGILGYLGMTWARYVDF